jgi:DUF4097 and DUF4098 domain-containing protein YvlB
MFFRPLAFGRYTCVWLCLTLLLAASLHAESGISVSREKGGWVAAIRGSLPAPAELRVVTGGNIVVRGGRGSSLSYTVSERFPGVSESEARRGARHLAAAIRSQARESTLTFSDIRQTVRLEVPRRTSRLSVISVAGDIEVTGIDGLVFTRNGAGRTTLDQIGGNAEVETAGGCTTLGLIGGNLKCVSGGGAIRARTIRGDSVFETSGGDIYAAEVIGPVKAYTGAGRIRIGRAGSSVTATTQGGAIEVGSAGGPVVANNSGGPIQVSSAPNVRCETAGGAIRVTGISGSVIATTPIGDILASLLGARLRAKSVIQTGRGDITVLIPSNVSVTLQATMSGGTGGISSDFPVRVTNRGPVMLAEGTINGGGPLLQIAGQNGKIFIKRQ